MQILDFVKSLIPSFPKDRLVEDARITKEELKNNVLPSYEAATPLITIRKFKSKELQELNDAFSRNTTVASGDNMIGSIAKGLVKVIDFQEAIEALIDQRFEKDIMVDGVTIYRANLIQAQSTATFVSRFSLDLLNYAYVLETEAVGADTSYTHDSLSKGDIEVINERFIEFVKAFNLMAKRGKDVKKELSNVPDVIVGRSPEAVTAVFDKSKLDPMGFSSLRGFTGSPIYSVRMIVAEWQVYRYKRMQETKQVLELRLLNLQSMMDKNPNAKLQQQIDYIQSRVDTYAEKMRKQEESVS